MKRIHPEDPRITQHALGELSHSEAALVDRAALLDPSVQAALDETRQLRGLLGEVMGRGELVLGEDRRAAIRSAGRGSGRGSAVAVLPSASLRRRWGRVALISSVAAGLMLATIFVLKEIPVKGERGPIAEGGKGVFDEREVMSLLLTPAPNPGRVARLAQGVPIAPTMPAAAGPGEELDEEWMAEYRALTRLLAEDPDRFFENVDRVVRSAELGEIADLPSLEDNKFIESKDRSRALVPVVSGTASYALVERFIRGEKALPPRNAVRVEELVNSIHYEAPGDSELEGVRLGAELVVCPWDTGKLLLGVLLQNGSEGMIPSTAALQLDIKSDLVKSYRLIGYAGMDTEGAREEREAALDAGLAPGRSNFVFFELEPTEKDMEERWVMARVLLMLGEGGKSRMIVPVMSPPRDWNGATDNFQTAAILAGYGLLLRDSEFRGGLDADYLTELAETSLFAQRNADLARREALQLVVDSRGLLLKR